jgi:Golgi phosphoprotein 3 (GPP34)
VLLAEDLLLLLTDDRRGTMTTRGDVVAIMLTGANLVELALMGRVEGRLRVRDPAPTDDAVLDATLQDVIASNGSSRPVLALKRQRAKKLRGTLYGRLVNRGMVRHEKGLFLECWPDQGSGHKVELRRRVIQALVEQTTPDTRTAALIALLHTIKHEPKIIDPGYAMSSRIVDWVGLTRAHRELIARGEEIANSNWAPEAMRYTIAGIIEATKRQAEWTTGG